jgi:hypothetical protein
MANAKLLLQYANISLCIVVLALLVTMWRQKLLSTFKTLALYLSAALAVEAVQLPLLFFRRYTGIKIDSAYNMVFYSNQVASVVETLLVIAVIYTVYRIAMTPFPGLQRIGKVVFRWVAGVSSVLALVVALSPTVFSEGSPATKAVTAVISRSQEGTNVLTLCLLLFVCFAIKPLGLTFRSHIFGISLGLGLIATGQLVEAAWFWTIGAHSFYSPIFLVSTLGYMVAFVVWGVYFVLPEPAQKIVTLPTTSPFFHWNRLAEALGEEPGQVAIGFSPKMLAPGEVKAMETINKFRLERIAAEKVAAEAQRNTGLDEIAAS